MYKLWTVLTESRNQRKGKNPKHKYNFPYLRALTSVYLNNNPKQITLKGNLPMTTLCLPLNKQKYRWVEPARYGCINKGKTLTKYINKYLQYYLPWIAHNQHIKLCSNLYRLWVQKYNEGTLHRSSTLLRWAHCHYSTLESHRMTAARSELFGLLLKEAGWDGQSADWMISRRAAKSFTNAGGGGAHMDLHVGQRQARAHTTHRHTDHRPPL